MKIFSFLQQRLFSIIVSLAVDSDLLQDESQDSFGRGESEMVGREMFPEDPQ